VRGVPPELRGPDGRWWTEGHRRYLIVRGTGERRSKHEVLALQLGVSVAFVGQLLSRRERPGFDLAYRMFKEYGIPMQTWHEPADSKAPLYLESSTPDSGTATNSSNAAPAAAAE
jgi:hypothetical protein